MEVRSEQTKKAFIQYLEEHPDERFWQSVRNFSGNHFVLVASDVTPPTGDYVDVEDTFYREGL